MKVKTEQRPRWGIDHILNSLIGKDVRVAARAFSPATWDGTSLPRLVPVGELVLPDTTQPAGLPVFFEGQLQRFERQIGVVFVRLESIPSLDTAMEGLVCF